MPGALLTTETAVSADAARLLSATRPFHGRGGRERSVKIVAGALLADRFLLSFHKRAFGADPLREVERLATGLSLPEAYRGSLGAHLAAADVVHFGYEGSPAGTTYKLYFEFAAAFRAGLAAAQSRGETQLLHLAYKWDPAEPRRRATTEYRALPCRARAQLERALAMLAGGESGPVFGLATRLVDRALMRTGLDDLLLMEVVEPGNPRRSFDLNLYPARLKITTSWPDIEAALEQLMIPPEAARSVLDRFGDNTLGHLSGGTGRAGEAFVTLYFGAEPIR